MVMIANVRPCVPPLPSLLASPFISAGALCEDQRETLKDKTACDPVVQLVALGLETKGTKTLAMA